MFILVAIFMRFGNADVFNVFLQHLSTSLSCPSIVTTTKISIAVQQVLSVQDNVMIGHCCERRDKAHSSTNSVVSAANFFNKLY